MTVLHNKNVLSSRFRLRCRKCPANFSRHVMSLCNHINIVQRLFYVYSLYRLFPFHMYPALKLIYESFLSSLKANRGFKPFDVSFLFTSPILLPATPPRFQGIYVTIIIEAVKCLNATRRNQWVKVNNAFSCFHRGWMELNFRRYSLEARADAWNLNNAFTAGSKSLVGVYCVRTPGSALSLQRFT